MSELDHPPTAHGADAAERYAALCALEAGLKAVKEAARAEALASVAGLSRASFPTAYGPVNVTTADEGIALDDEAFLAMVEEHYPDDVVVTRSVSPALRRAFLDRLVAVGGKVVHQDTGEVVDFARVIPRGAPTLSYPASTAQREAKAWAVALFEERAATLADALREVAAPTTTQEVTR